MAPGLGRRLTAGLFGGFPHHSHFDHGFFHPAQGLPGLGPPGLGHQGAQGVQDRYLTDEGGNGILRQGDLPGGSD